MEKKMNINAKIGQRVPLKDLIPDSGKVVVGLGWEKRKAEGDAHDLDSSIIMLESDGICKGPDDVCFYQEGYRTQHGNSVVHHGDNFDGSEHGDDERIELSLKAIPARITTIVIVASIHKAVERKQNFGQVDDAYVRLVNPDTLGGLLTYDLAEDASMSTAVEFAHLQREGSEWYFEAKGAGTARGLGSIMQKYGLVTKNG